MFVEYSTDEEQETTVVKERSEHGSSLQELRDVVDDEADKNPMEHRRKVRQKKQMAERRLSKIWIPGMSSLVLEEALQNASPKSRELKRLKSRVSRDSKVSKSQKSNGYGTVVTKGDGEEAQSSKSKTLGHMTEQSKSEETEN